jgi:hypothetical protein
MSFVKELDTALLRLGKYDLFTFRDLCKGGLHVLSESGGGKTSGVGAMAAGALLRSGAGGCVTICKPEDISMWQRYAVEHNRAGSLLLFDENEGFNFLHYLMARHGMEGIGAVTETLMLIVELARQATGSTGNGGDVFWLDSARQVLRYALPPLYAANGSFTIPDIIRFITTAPKNEAEPMDANWQKRSFMYSVMEAATHAPKIPMSATALRNCITYWAEEFCATPSKTLGNVISTITTSLDRFRHGRLNKAFCQTTTVVPELTFHGAVILLAMPTATWDSDGLIGQQLFKFLWQRAVLSRNSLPEKHRERFLFLFSDEAQDTVNLRYDSEFLSICRGSKCCVIFMTQTLPSYFAKIGGPNPRDAALSLVGKFTNHFYGANSCAETNEFAARTIGKVLKRRRNFSQGTSHSTTTGFSEGSSQTISYSSMSPNCTTGFSSNWSMNEGSSLGRSENAGYSESMEYLIEPGEFARNLKCGGSANDFEVTGVWFQSSRVFEATGRNILLARFKQQ